MMVKYGFSLCKVIHQESPSAPTLHIQNSIDGRIPICSVQSFIHMSSHSSMMYTPSTTDTLRVVSPMMWLSDMDRNRGHITTTKPSPCVQSYLNSFRKVAPPPRPNTFVLCPTPLSFDDSFSSSKRTFPTNRANFRLKT